MNKINLFAIISIPVLALTINKLNLKEQSHPNNLFWLKESPMGIVVSKLLNSQIDTRWEGGSLIRVPVNKKALNEISINPISIINATGNLIDQLNQTRVARTNKEPMSEKMFNVYRTRLAKDIKYTFELDPTNGAALQLSLTFVSEFDPSALTKPAEDRYKVCQWYVETATRAYNLDPNKGNPLHAILISDAEFTLYIIKNTLKLIKSKEQEAKERKLAIDQANFRINQAEQFLKQRILSGVWQKTGSGKQANFWIVYNTHKHIIQAFDKKTKPQKPSEVLTRILKPAVKSAKELKQLVRNNLPIEVEDLQNKHLHQISKDNIFK